MIEIIKHRRWRIAFVRVCAVGAFLPLAPLGRVAAQGFENLDSGLVSVPIGDDNRADGVRAAVDLTTTFRELNQGNAVAPLFLLHALHDEKGLSMLDLLERYGFMADGGPRRGLASGFTLQEGTLPLLGWDLSRSGFSCTACHSGEFHYKNKRYRVDGMPGLVDIEGWTLALSAAVDRNKPGSSSGGRELLRTIKRAIRYCYDWRVDSGHAANNLAPRFEPSDIELFERSVDDLLERSAVVFPQAAGGNRTVTPFSPETLARDPELRGYQLSLLGGTFGSEMMTVPELRFLEAETENFMRQRWKFAGDRGIFNGATSRFAFIGEMASHVRREYGILAGRYANGRSLIAALKSYPPPGYGRDDAWGLIDRFVGGSEKTVLNRPISIPPLFGCGKYRVYHCDGNTNSMMERNIAQAVALGAAVDKKGAADISLRAVGHANMLAARIHGPEWPSFFPPLEPAKVARGRELFEEKKYDGYQSWDYLGKPIPATKASCADCHQTPATIEDQRYYNVGTSQVRLNHYPEQPGVLDKVATELGRIRAATLGHELNKDITDMEAAMWDPNGEPWWREQKGYVARALDGIWASPPYLHNGSVPTLAALFSPVARRPKEFHVGSKEFDPENVGFVSKENPEFYFFDTTRPGNRNQGHEFGTELPEADREALMEYLKTFSRGSRAAPAGGP